MSPSHPRLALPLLLALAAACTTGSGASEDPAPSGASGSGEFSAAVLVATLTPEARLLQPSPTAVPSLTAEPSDTPSPTETPLSPTATDTLTPTITLTPSPTPSPTATQTPTMTPTPIVIDGITLSQQEQILFAAHNQERVRLDIDPLSLDADLMDIARERAETMVESGVFSHYAPDGETVFDLLDDADFEYGDATENIHYNDVLTNPVGFAMMEYLRSPAHRANIVDPGFRRVGISFVTAPSGVHYAVVVFTD